MAHPLTEERPFSNTQVANFVRFQDTLQRIHERLAREGTFLDDGRTWNVFKFAPLCEAELEEPLKNKKQYERKNNKGPVRRVLSDI